MGYEAREDARNDALSEAAHEAFNNGNFEEEIKQEVLDGNYDEQLMKRIAEVFKALDEICKTKEGDELTILGTTVRIKRLRSDGKKPHCFSGRRNVCERLEGFKKGDVVAYVKILDKNVPVSRDEALMIFGCNLPQVTT